MADEYDPITGDPILHLGPKNDVSYDEARDEWVSHTHHEVPMSDCPNAANHRDRPSGYTAAFEWRKEMAKTHKVSRCPDCLRFVIWTPKEQS